MLNPSTLQSAPTASAPLSSPPSSSTGNPAASSGGSQASGTPSFSKVLAGEMHGKEDANASASPGAMNPGTAPDIRTQNPAFAVEPAVAMPEAAPAKHATRAGSAAGAMQTDRESTESPEEDNAGSLAGILASLGAAQPALAPAPVAVDARIANTRSGARDSAPGDANSVSTQAGREETGQPDIFPWAGGNGAGGTGTGGPGDRGMAKTGAIAPGENFTAGAQVAQAAPVAKGKQSVLLNVEENAGKTEKMDRAERADRADAGRLDATQRNDFKFSLLNSGVADESERKTVMDAAFQSSLPSPSAVPQMGFMTPPMERGFAMADTAPSAALSVMQDLQTPVGASGWDDALGQKVLWMVSSQEQVAELSLNPPDLGPLQVTLSISNDQATATFVSQHADVRQALEAALPRLKEMMAESGINLGGASVSSGGDGSQQQGSERQSRSGSRYSSGEILAGQGNDNGMITSNPGRKNRLVDIFA